MAKTELKNMRKSLARSVPAEERTTADSVSNQILPPNGGLTAWLQVFGSFFVFFNTWGLLNLFGALEAFYGTHYLSSYSTSEISWIGTVQGYLILFGAVGGPLYDQGHMRHLLCAGTFLLVLGIMMASLATQYYSIFLSLSITTGLGMGTVFFPGIAACTAYFTTRRATAIGLASLGSGIGAVVYPMIIRELIDMVGFPWAMRTVGFIALATLAIPILVAKPLFLAEQARKLVDLSCMNNKLIISFTVANFFLSAGNFQMQFYIATFAEDVLGSSQSESFTLLTVLGAGSCAGRIAPSVAADWLGPIPIYATCALFTAICNIGWVGATTYGGALAISFVYGLSVGGMLSLPPPIVALIAPDPREAGTILGMTSTVAGLGFLVGSPIAGTIIETRAGYHGLQAFSVACLFIGAAASVVVEWMRRRHISSRPAVVAVT